tara:strand:- start:570 stop:767 length:198 start_codon:yes stop_codon:yes gene_type:complete
MTTKEIKTELNNKLETIRTSRVRNLKNLDKFQEQGNDEMVSFIVAEDKRMGVWYQEVSEELINVA